MERVLCVVRGEFWRVSMISGTSIGFSNKDVKNVIEKVRGYREVTWSVGGKIFRYLDKEEKIPRKVGP